LVLSLLRPQLRKVGVAPVLRHCPLARRLMFLSLMSMHKYRPPIVLQT
jgi:hypothetical protein